MGTPWYGDTMVWDGMGTQHFVVWGHSILWTRRFSFVVVWGHSILWTRRFSFVHFYPLWYGDTAFCGHADLVLYTSILCLAEFAVEVEVIHGSVGSC